MEAAGGKDRFKPRYDHEALTCRIPSTLPRKSLLHRFNIGSRLTEICQPTELTTGPTRKISLGPRDC